MSYQEFEPAGDVHQIILGNGMAKARNMYYDTTSTEIIAYEDDYGEQLYACTRMVSLPRMRAVRREPEPPPSGNGVAHDFDSLLRCALAMLKEAASSIPSGSPACEYVETAHSALLRASDLCKGLSAFSGKNTVPNQD